MSERNLLKKALEALEPVAEVADEIGSQAQPDIFFRAVRLGHIRAARAVHAEIKAALDSDAADGWHPIETAPKNDRTMIDLWVVWDRGERSSRVADCFWCDMENFEGWMERASGDRITGGRYSSGEPTHWRAPPAPPIAAARTGQDTEEG